MFISSSLLNVDVGCDNDVRRRMVIRIRKRDSRIIMSRRRL
jgi:hypothetical protein